MRQIGPDTYVCTLCNATVFVSGLEPPVAVIVGQSGRPNIRVVSVEGVEVHRCAVAAEPTPSTPVRTGGAPT
jgi:hypothetical protein